MPEVFNTVFTITQALKIIKRPTTTEVIMPFACAIIFGLAPAKRSITPPITSIKTAIVGTTQVNNCPNTLLAIIKIWQSWHGSSPSPPQGTSPAACVCSGMRYESTKVIINIFFAIVIILFSRGDLPIYNYTINFFASKRKAATPRKSCG